MYIRILFVKTDANKIEKKYITKANWLLIFFSLYILASFSVFPIIKYTKNQINKHIFVYT